jgi:nucleoid-associated protein YgaU
MGRYYGRHRVPVTPRRVAARIAATASAVAAPFLAPGQASAEMPDNVRAAIVECESSGNPTAQSASSSASGLYQFITGTWRAFGGAEFAPTAKQASAAEQHIVADRAFAANGTADWEADPRSEACWRPKLGKHSSGQEAPRHAAPTRAPAQHAAPAAAGDEYVVRAGDTLSKIAARHDSSWPELYEANDDILDSPHRIYPGQQLRV